MLRGLGVAWGGNVFVEIVQEQSWAHLKPRDLSSKYVQIADAINSLNSSKQPLPLAAVWPLFTCQNRLEQHPHQTQFIAPKSWPSLLGRATRFSRC